MVIGYGLISSKGVIGGVEGCVDVVDMGQGHQLYFHCHFQWIFQ